MSSGDSRRKYRGRVAQLEALGNGEFDVLIIGGGISGIATAHVLLERGYRTALIDSHDFSSGTSQESSQLIWGGIKYLENREFGLVRELCLERNALARDYSDRVSPLRFLYPHFAHDEHWLLTLLAGSWLYHAMGNGFDRMPLARTSARIKSLIPLIREDRFGGGFEYSDARMTDSDARLTLDLLFDAMECGLTAVNYVSFEERMEAGRDGLHRLRCRDAAGGDDVEVRARWVVNATGVWTDEINARLGVTPPFRHLFSKGIHIVLKRIETGDRALTCLSRDGRPFFVIPWGGVTLVGTTDTPFDEPARRVTADGNDINYLRRECESKFRLKIDDADILNTKAGLRPLLAPAGDAVTDFLALARSHKVWSDAKAGVTAVWGGKYTSCFSMGSEIADQVAVGPNGERVPHIDPLAREYPVDDELIVEDRLSPEALRQACRREMVVRIEDLLRRRTNIGLKVPRGGRGANDENRRAIEIMAVAIADVNGSPAGDVFRDYWDPPRAKQAGAAGAGGARNAGAGTKSLASREARGG